MEVFPALEEQGQVAKDVDPTNRRTYYLIADLQDPNPLRGNFYEADENAS